MNLNGLSPERRGTGGELREGHIQSNQWVALLYFESQKAKQNRSDMRPGKGLVVSGVAAIVIHIQVRKAPGSMNRVDI